ncbi:C40 family peptidase [Algoriphagus sp. CAU 1675]|uniref:C40 family peptidase n=1 Tax=Algoriphagus sp. CAU 1675 TaxID=3032597 RepID=UPI0023DC0F47|nr:C40 family peptidase [Algoriphagus sp. CAU 1675]MDF2158786.1 C40 family peptidase [Algoriphagus sp. CAU 1675]
MYIGTNKSVFGFFNLGFLLLFFILLSGLPSCKSKKIGKEDPVFKVVATAKSFRGTPYKYGGTTRSGIDCSALIYHSYYSVGRTMPRTSSEQARLGTKVKAGNFKEGDLLFFATGRKKNQVTHAGIVTEVHKGDVRFIHASTSLGVTEDFLSNRYWSKAFLFGRRILE